MCVVCVGVFFFVKQKTAYEMRISDWSSDVCSSDLGWSRLGRAVGASLFSGTLATILVATVRVAPDRIATRGSDLRTLRSAGRRFLPARSVDELLAGAPATGPVPAPVEARLERELAAVLGSAFARLLLDAARRTRSDEDPSELQY